MKKSILIFLVLAANVLNAQDSIKPIIKDTAWKVMGFLGANATRTELSDWQGGGQNNTALGTLFNLEIRYKRDEFEQWINKLDAQYGLIRQGDVSNYKKNLDQLFFLSRYNTRAFGKNFYWLAQADYRTQFAPGYNFNGDSIIGQAVSDFNSPGYIQLALGLDYKPKDYFSVTLAPLAGKVTMVNRQYLADEGAYGVDPAVVDDSGRMISRGKKVRYEMGGRILMKFKKDIVKNVNWDSYLDLFTNYFDKPGNVDVIFNNLVTMKLGKFFTINFISQAMYDDDVVRQRDFDRDGKYESEGDINGPRVQLLTTWAFGFGYKF